MARSTAAENPLADAFRNAQGLLALNPVLQPQIRQFWEAQENILNDAEAFSRHWFARRHEATQSALDAARRVAEAGNGDTTSAMKALSAWQAESAERVAEDLMEWFDLCSRCAGHLAGHEVEAGREVLEAATRRATEASTRHATPV